MKKILIIIIIIFCLFICGCENNNSQDVIEDEELPQVILSEDDSILVRKAYIKKYCPNYNNGSLKYYDCILIRYYYGEYNGYKVFSINDPKSIDYWPRVNIIAGLSFEYRYDFNEIFVSDGKACYTLQEAWDNNLISIFDLAIIYKYHLSYDDSDKKFRSINYEIEYYGLITTSLYVKLKPAYSQYRGVSNYIYEKFTSIDKVASIEPLKRVPDEYLLDDKTLDPSKPEAGPYNVSARRQKIRVWLSCETKEELFDVARQFEALDEVYYVDLEYRLLPTSVTPSDTYFLSQWALNGDYGIEANEAWEFTTGTRAVRVGIIDSGIVSHEDLNANVVTGYDYYNNNATTTDDPTGHGTCVAGIIGAEGDNDRGVTGINYHISLVPLQTIQYFNSEWVHDPSDVAEAISEADDNWNSNDKIPIINMSIDGFGTAIGLVDEIQNYQGLIIWAAGNDGQNVDSFADIDDFNLNNIISVGAIDSSGNRSIWNETRSSNYGNAVDIYAPGGGESDLLSVDCATTGYLYYSHYKNFDGTSCAAPHVAGVAALLLSIDPSLEASQLKTAILEGADDIVIQVPTGPGGSLENQYVKKLNAYGAVKYVLTNRVATPYTLNNSITTINISHTALANNDYFTNDNGFYKLNVSSSTQYDFNVSSSYPIDVLLYDSNYNQLTYTDLNNSSSIVKFNKSLLSGTYYLRVKYQSSTQSGTINTQIKHNHSYTDHYVWKNLTEHKSYCACGEYTTSFHIVSPDAFQSGLLTAPCLLCNGPASFGGLIHDGIGNYPYTLNGSFVLPNGIIVLEEADMEAYLNGTLIFINPNENIDRSKAFIPCEYNKK